MSTISHPAPMSPLARFLLAVARSTAPLSRPLAGRRFFPLWAVLHHRGRRSGRTYSVPVAIRAVDDAFIIPIPFGARTQWLRNVVAAGEGAMRWRGQEQRVVDPRIIGFDDAAPAFNHVQLAIIRATGMRTFLRLRRAGTGDQQPMA